MSVREREEAVWHAGCVHHALEACEWTHALSTGFSGEGNEMFSKRMNQTLLLAFSICASGVMATNLRAAAPEVINFRLPQWKAAHFDDAKSAEANFKTFKQLGCEVEQGQHGSHFDVRYRCPAWRGISFESHDEAHRWERWLNASGFETSHKH
jgi:hypothetical protein